MKRTLLRTTAGAITVLSLGAGLAACGPDDKSAATQAGRTPSPATGTVAIKTFIFRPDPVRVKAGTEVTWDNKDDILHTVTAGKRGHPTGLFDKKLNLNDKFSHTFRKPGTYPYVCTIHMGMDGTVVVS